jgi:hypothetical protein
MPLIPRATSEKMVDIDHPARLRARIASVPLKMTGRVRFTRRPDYACNKSARRYSQNLTSHFNALWRNPTIDSNLHSCTSAI